MNYNSGAAHCSDMYPPYDGEPAGLPAARNQIIAFLEGVLGNLNFLSIHCKTHQSNRKLIRNEETNDILDKKQLRSSCRQAVHSDHADRSYDNNYEVINEHHVDDLNADDDVRSIGSIDDSGVPRNCLPCLKLYCSIKMDICICSIEWE